MADTEKEEQQTAYVIPANYIESGRILNGMLKTRNTIEAVIAVFIGYMLLSVFPLTTEAGLFTKVAILGPVAILFLVGINDGPASTYIFSYLHWLRKKAVFKYNENATPLMGTALDAIENRKAPGEKLQEKFREWRDTQAEKQLAEETEYTFATDPYVTDLNKYFASRQGRENDDSATNNTADNNITSDSQNPPWIEESALNIDDPSIWEGGYFG